MIDALALAALHASGCLVLGLAASRLLRHPARAHAALCYGLVAAVLAIPASLWIGRTQTGWMERPAPPATKPATPVSLQPPTASPSDVAPMSIARDTRPPAPLATPTAAPRVQDPLPARATWSWTALFVIGWSAASLWLALRWVLSMRRARQALAASQPVEEPRLLQAFERARSELLPDRTVRLRSSPIASSPLIWSWSRTPTVLVSPSTRDARIDWTTVFRHELAHHRRRDHLVHTLAHLLAIAVPFHPLLWWTRSRLVTLAENACDAWAARDDHASVRLAESLLAFTPRSTPAGMSPARGVHGIKARVQTLLRRRVHQPTSGRTWRAAAAALTLLTAAGVVVTQPAHSQQPWKSDSTLSVQVKDVDGSLVAHAHVALSFRGAAKADPKGVLLSAGSTDEDGSWSCPWPTHLEGIQRRFTLLAWTPGRVMGAVDVDSASLDEATVVTLRPSTEITGTVFDLDGASVSDARVSVQGLSFPERDGFPEFWLPELAPDFASETSRQPTDDEGRFTLTSVPEGAMVWLNVQHEDHAWVRTRIRAIDPETPLSIVLDPGQRLTGRVLADGVPVPGALLRIESTRDFDYHGEVVATTDEDGTYSTQLYSGEEVTLLVTPPANSGLLPHFRGMDWNDASAVRSLDVSLESGRLVTGVVQDEDNQPVSGVRITYHPVSRNNPHYRSSIADAIDQVTVTSDAQGRFTLTVPLGRGRLLALATDPSFSGREISSAELEGLPPGGERRRYAAIKPLELDGRDAPVKSTLTLKRGWTLTGQVRCSDGTPPTKAVVYGTSIRKSSPSYRQGTLDLEHGQLHVPGLKRGERHELFVFDAARQEGACIVIPADHDILAPFDVQLVTCRTARARLTDSNGNPLANLNLQRSPLSVFFTQVIRGGELHYQVDAETYNAETLIVGNLDRDRFSGLTTDDDGVVIFPNVIPGARYQLQYSQRVRWASVAPFTATDDDIDLGTIELIVP